MRTGHGARRGAADRATRRTARPGLTGASIPTLAPANRALPKSTAQGVTTILRPTPAANCSSACG